MSFSALCPEKRLSRYVLIRPSHKAIEDSTCIGRLQQDAVLTDKSVAPADSRNKAEGCIVFTVTNHVQLQVEF